MRNHHPKPNPMLPKPKLLMSIIALIFILFSLAAATCAGVGSGMNFHVSLVYFLGGKAPVCWFGFRFCDELAFYWYLSGELF